MWDSNTWMKKKTINCSTSELIADCTYNWLVSICHLVNIIGCPDCRFHCRLNPSVREGCVLPCKVHPVFTLKKLMGILHMLVWCEQSESTQAVGICTPLLHYHAGAERPDVVTVDQCQISQGHLFEVIITHTQEEEGVIRPGVGSQEDADLVVVWETVTGVVDETSGPVCDALSSTDTIPLPEPLAESEEDFS